MRRLLIALPLLLSAVGCARNPDVRVVTEEGPAVRKESARSAGRPAGAGGSHAPGGTGLGAGTLGADQTAEPGSAR